MGPTEQKSAPPAGQVVRQAATSPEDAKSRIARSLFSNWAGMGANVLVGFLLAPFVVHRLGDTAYGIWALVLQLTGYMGVFTVGMRSALVRFVARFSTEHDQPSMNRLLSMTLTVYSGFAFVSIALGAALAVYALPHMQIPLAMRRESQIVLILAAITLGAGFPLGMFQAVLSGLSRFDLTNGVNIVTLLLRTALVVALLLEGYGLVALAVVHLLVSLLTYGWCAILVFKLMPGTKISWRLWDKALVRPVFGHSLYSFLISVGTRINYEMDTVVIAAFLPVQSVTFYVIGFKLIQSLRDLVNLSSVVVAPIASGLEAQRKTGEISSLLVRGCRYVLLAAFPINAGLLILGPDFIQAWMGSEYRHISGTVLVILVLGQFVAFTEHVPTQILYGLSKHRVNVWCTALESALNLGLSIALVRPFGVFGVAMGTTIGALIVRGWLFPRGYLRILGVGWVNYLRSSIVPALLSTLVFCVGVLAFRQVIGTSGFLRMGLAAASGLVLYAPCVWILVFDQGERSKFRRYLPWVRWGREMAG